MTDHPKGLNASADLLEWVWAYRQALALLDRFDAEGLDCAATCETDWPEKSWHRFLDTYGLKRGKNAKLRDRRADIFREVVPIIRPPLGNTALEELQQRWREAVDRIGRLCTRKNKNGGDPTLWSLVSKLLWFYQPDLMTMYDEHARKGLHDEYARQALAATYRAIKPAKNYLRLFEQLLEKKRADIDRAAKFSDRKYPYPRRVLDQWLWLKGSGDKADRLRAFRLSLERASIFPRDLDSAPLFSWQEGGAAAPSLKDEILAISKRCAALPDRDPRSAAEILGYDEHGLPQ